MKLRGGDRRQIEHFAPFLLANRPVPTPVPTMVFVDGENLTKRYQQLMTEKNTGWDRAPSRYPSLYYEPDVFLWSNILNEMCRHLGTLRTHYYTSASGNTEHLQALEDLLKAVGIEAPYVFKRPKPGSNRPSKGVDIALTVDMLSHAHRKNYALAILIAGDADYVPLVNAVKAEGCRVYIWFFDESHGLSRDLRLSADHYADISIAFPF